jgi:DNA-binding NtrC family response regulator
MDTPLSTGTIVIIEDDTTMGSVLRRVVRDIAPGYDIVSMQHGAGVLVQLDARWVPLVITDFSMPDMDGVEVTSVVKARSPQTYVLAVTGLNDPAIEPALRAAGVDGFLQKPFLLDELTELVRSAISHLPRPRERIASA